MDYTLHRPSPAPTAAHLTAAAPPPYYPPASSYLSAPNPISAAAANPYASPAANYLAPYAPYGRYAAAAAAADPGVGHATTETPSYYYNTAGGTGGHSLPLNEGDAPSKDPGLGQAYYYNAVGGSQGGGYGHALPAREGAGTFVDQGQGHAPSSYYRGALGGSGIGGYGNGLSVAPYSDASLGQARAPYSDVGLGQAYAPYSDVGLGQARAPLRYPHNSAAGGVGGGGGAGGGYAHGLVVKEAIRQYGFDPQVQQTQTWSSTGLEPTAFARPSQIPLPRSNATINNTSSTEMMRGPPRRKPAQSASCEVCKIKCNNKEVLMIHKQGRKHKANMLKLQQAITAKPAAVDKKVEGSSVASEDEDEKKRAAPGPATVEELVVKKRRVLEGGAAASEIKICSICNVVVNSQYVLDRHLAGQRHAAMVEQQAS